MSTKILRLYAIPFLVASLLTLVVACTPGGAVKPVVIAIAKKTLRVAVEAAGGDLIRAASLNHTDKYADQMENLLLALVKEVGGLNVSKARRVPGNAADCSYYQTPDTGNGYMAESCGDGESGYPSDPSYPDSQYPSDQSQYPDSQYPSDQQQYPETQYPSDQQYPNDQQQYPQAQYPNDQQQYPQAQYPNDQQQYPQTQYPNDQQQYPQAQYPNDQQQYPSDQQYPNDQQQYPQTQYPNDQQQYPQTQYPNDQQQYPQAQYPNDQQQSPQAQYPNDQQQYPQAQYPNDQQQYPQAQYPNDQQQYPANPQYAGSQNPVSPQNQSRNTANDLAFDFTLLKSTPAGPIPIQDGETLFGQSPGRSADKIKVNFSTQCACYVYIIGIDTTGFVAKIFPDPESNAFNPAEPGRNYELPSANTWWGLDEQQGTETIYLFMSREPRNDIDQILASMSSTQQFPSGSRGTVEAVTNTFVANSRGLRKVSDSGPAVSGQPSRTTDTYVASLSDVNADVILTRWFEHR